MKSLKIALPLLAVVFFLRFPALSAQTPAEVDPVGEAIGWMTWEEANRRMQEEPRKIVLDIFAEWCDMCRHMESTTFRHPDLARYINEHFYPVRLDAQQKDVLTYRKKTYRYISRGRGGFHQLASELLRGRMSFPAIVFLDEDLELIQSFVGYKTPAQFEKIAAYFGSDVYKSTPWSTFRRTFTPCISE